MRLSSSSPRGTGNINNKIQDIKKDEDFTLHEAEVRFTNEEDDAAKEEGDVAIEVMMIEDMILLQMKMKMMEKEKNPKKMNKYLYPKKIKFIPC